MSTLIWYFWRLSPKSLMLISIWFSFFSSRILLDILMKDYEFEFLPDTGRLRKPNILCSFLVCCMFSELAATDTELIIWVSPCTLTLKFIFGFSAGGRKDVLGTTGASSFTSDFLSGESSFSWPFSAFCSSTLLLSFDLSAWTALSFIWLLRSLLDYFDFGSLVSVLFYVID